MNEFNIPDRFYKRLNEIVNGGTSRYGYGCIICSGNIDRGFYSTFCKSCKPIYEPIYETLWQRRKNRAIMIHRMQGIDVS